MSQYEENQITHQGDQIPYDRRILLIRAVRKRPRLYKHEFLRTPLLQRQEKQALWDEVSHEARYYKTEDAKVKWRSLINYLRQHLEHVAQKKQRRYIPNTQNPEDKYIQLNDWAHYNEMEFIVPYVKYSASKETCGNYLNPTTSEMDVIIKSIEEELENKMDECNSQEFEGSHDVSNNNLEIDNEEADEEEEDNLTPDDIILKEFFENMLKSTLSLPRFHQNIIKKKLIQSINEQQNVK